MAKSNGIKDLKQAAKLLNKHAPDGEKLAYINKKEAELLRAHGGSGIQTLQGVPSYISIFGWDIPGTESINLTGSDILGKGAEWLGWKDKDGPIRLDEIGKDVASVWVGLEAKKNQEGLNEHEQKLYNDLKAQMAEATTQFALNVGQGPQVQNVPTKIEDVASYTDVTLPTMKTTAVAEGGRIGYNQGSFGSYKDYLESLPDNDKLLELYADGDIAGVIKELKRRGIPTDDHYAKGGRIGYNIGGVTGEQNAMVIDMLNKGMDHDTISTITGITPEDIQIIINQINEAQSGLEQSGALENLNLKAHGGRIGYNLGGIGAMDPRIGYAQGMGPHWDVPTFSEGVEQMYESGPLGAIEQTNEDWFAQNWTPMGPGRLEKDLAGKPHTETMSLISEKVSANFELLKGMRDRGMIDETLTDEELLKTAYKNVKHNYLGQEQEGMPQIKIQENIQEMPMAAYGGRIGAKEGGIMPLLNLGGMEKDYRQDGGFVPIGRREKADDVPARLSKNEFVFTADAVRNAGGGDIDKGAQRMYNVMKNLEAGGEISEQSQGQV